MRLRDLRGVGPAYSERLCEAGIADAADLAWVEDLEALSARTGIPAPRLASFRAQAIRLVEERHRPPLVAARQAVAATERLGSTVAGWMRKSLARLNPF